MDLQRFVIELEEAVLRDVPLHCPYLRSEITQLVYGNAAVEQDSNVDRWARMFIEQYKEGWRRRAHHGSFWSEPLISGSLVLVRRPLLETGLFKERFSDAWNGLVAPHARDTILAYWQQGTLPAGIELTAEYSPKESPAKTCLWGYQICFDASRIFKHADAEFPTYAITHEMAHVWCYATDDPIHRQPAPRIAQELLDWQKALEDRARTVLSQWGVNMDKHDAFVRDVQTS